MFLIFLTSKNKPGNIYSMVDFGIKNGNYLEIRRVANNVLSTDIFSIVTYDSRIYYIL